MRESWPENGFRVLGDLVSLLWLLSWSSPGELVGSKSATAQNMRVNEQGLSSVESTFYHFALHLLAKVFFGDFSSVHGPSQRWRCCTVVLTTAGLQQGR